MADEFPDGGNEDNDKTGDFVEDNICSANPRDRPKLAQERRRDIYFIS